MATGNATRGLLLRGVGGSRSAVVEPFMLGGVVKTYVEPFDLAKGKVAYSVVEPFELGVTTVVRYVERFQLGLGVKIAVIESFAVLGPSDVAYEGGALAQPRIGRRQNSPEPVKPL